MLAGNKATQGNSFESERDILYQVLFDMRQDMAELKRQVNSLMGGEVSMQHHRSTGNGVAFVERPMPQQPTTISITSAKEHMHDDYEIQDTEEYVEEVMSLENAEKELIRKALIRSRGRRKVAAQELKISERTLYRKIKEYNLEEY